MEPSDLPDRHRRREGSCLTILLTGGFAGLILVTLLLATGGWVAYIVWIAAAIFLFGAVHYLLWGRLLLQQTAGEREEEEMRKRTKEREQREAEPSSNGIRRLP